MAEFVVNVALIAALLVLLTVWTVRSRRRRRSDRAESAEQRRLILDAVTGHITSAASGSRATVNEHAHDPSLQLGQDGGDEEQPGTAVVRPAHRANPDREARPALQVQVPDRPDPTSVALLLDLLEERSPARPGMFVGLLGSPQSVWRAGQAAGRRTITARPAAHAEDAHAKDGTDLYRDAARELLDIHRYDPGDACEQYTRYAAALGDPALALIYLRSAAHAAYAEPSQLEQVTAEITGTSSPATLPSRTDRTNAGA